MNSRVTGLMGTQRGLLTRAQAIDAGMAPEQIDRLVKHRRWTAVRPGVYADTAYVASLTTVRERRLLVDRAVCMKVQSPHVLSHHSAAYLLGLPVLHERPPTAHLTRPGIVGSHHRSGVKHHRAPYRDEQLVVVDGVRCLDAARTALDIARERGFLQGLVAGDSALRAGATRADLQRWRDQMRSWPHSTVMDDVIASVDPDTDSIGETLLRDLVESLGYGRPQVQFGLTADGRTAWCDLRLGRHVFEFDGAIKYLGAADGGVASADPTEILWDEKQRQDFICGFKLGVSHSTWADVFGPGVEPARERLRREFLDTCSRFGRDISDLAPFRPRQPRPRPQVNRQQEWPFAA